MEHKLILISNSFRQNTVLDNDAKIDKKKAKIFGETPFLQSSRHLEYFKVNSNYAIRNPTCDTVVGAIVMFSLSLIVCEIFTVVLSAKDCDIFIVKIF